MKIRSKINLLVGFLSLVACSIGGLSIYAINKYQTHAIALDAVADRARFGETLNRLVTAVVMESRGVYAAKDTAAAGKFADGIITNLDAMATLLKEWKPRVPAY